MLERGHGVLRELINYIHTTHRGIPVIVDCKIGDIENTMAVYIENVFSLLHADGIVVNPYMGDDVVMPLVELSDKIIVVLVKTSNPSGGIIQDTILANGQPLWRYVLDMVVGRWNAKGNMVPVLAAVAGIDMVEIRKIIPDDMLILLAGIGAQGGTYKSLCNLLNLDGIGVFVNSSRAILYPQQTQESWCVAVGQAATELKDALNSERGAR